MNLGRAVQSGLIVGTLDAGTLARRMVAKSDLIAVGKWYPAGASGGGARLLRGGWHAGEDWGAWGKGDRHALHLPLLATSGDLVIEAEVAAALLGPRRMQKVLLAAAHHQLGTWTFTQSRNRGVRSVRIPPEAMHREGDTVIVDLEFHPQLAVAPRELEDGLSDDRMLGVGLFRFRVLDGTQQSDSVIVENALIFESGFDSAGGLASPWDTEADSIASLLAPRRSLTWRALAKGARILRAMQIPHFDKFERRARRAIEATHGGLTHPLRSSQLAVVEGFERKIEKLEQRLAAYDSDRRRAANALEDRLAEAAAVQLAGQRRLERLLSGLTASNAPSDSRGDAHLAAIDAALERQRDSSQVQTAAFLAKMDRLTETLESFQNSQATGDEKTRRLARESRDALDQLRELMIRGGLESSEILGQIGKIRAGVDYLLTRNVIPIEPGILMVRNPYGYLCVPAEDEKLVAFVADGILPEAGTRKILETLLKPGATFLDIGANIGMFTLIAARLVGPSGRVIAVEPMPRVVALLRKSVGMAGIENIVEIHEVAASDVRASTMLNVTFPYTHSSLYDLPGAHTAIEVACVPIDDLPGSISKIDVIKIDVEGAELAVLRGMRRTLASNPEAVAIVEFGPSHLKRANITIEDWMQELRNLEFDIWEIDDENLRLRPLRETGLEDVFSLNLLLTRGKPELLRTLMPEETP